MGHAVSKTANRRGFLAAIVALPVAAKEAAGKLGLQGPLGWGVEGGLLHGPHPGSALASSADAESFWQRQLRKFTTSRSQQRYRRISARQDARRLDPDLASMRSISPAAAYALQCDRCVARHERDGRQAIIDEIYDETIERAERGLN